MQRLGELPRDRPVVVHCASGYRSAIGNRYGRRRPGELVHLDIKKLGRISNAAQGMP